LTAEQKRKIKRWTLPKLTLTQYLQRNFHITTSGWFSNRVLRSVIDTVGEDRVLFSIDYPYEYTELASDWIEEAPLSKKVKEKIAFGNAAKLLKIENKKKKQEGI
jgi:predicted TIM-barrel fold metal-dependent hydrolase